MPREHARILCSIWSPGDDFRDRSLEAQRLYFLLLSQRELNNAGVMPLMPAKWARLSSNTSVEDIEQALKELEEHRYVVVDRETDELLVRTFIRNDGVAKVPNVLTSALRLAEQIESQPLRTALAAELLRLGHPRARDTAAQLAPDVVANRSLNGSRNSSGNGSPNPPQPVDNNRSPNPSPSPAGRGRGRGGEVPSRATSDRPRERASPHDDPAAAVRERLQSMTTTPITEEHAAAVVDQVLRAATTTIRNPTKYVLGAIARDDNPSRFLPASLPPRFRADTP